MSKQKLRGITDKDLAGHLNHLYARSNMLGSRALKQRGYNRTVAAAVALLYVIAVGQAGWFDGLIGMLKEWW